MAAACGGLSVGEGGGGGGGGAGATRAGRMPPTQLLDLLKPEAQAPRQHPPPVVAFANCQTLQRWSLQQAIAQASAVAAEVSDASPPHMTLDLFAGKLSGDGQCDGPTGGGGGGPGGPRITVWRQANCEAGRRWAQA